MSATESDFEPSADEQPRTNSRPRQSRTPKSPRKRRRSQSESPDRQRNSKRHLDGQYNDAYRGLFNEHVTAAATRFDLTDPFFHDSTHPIHGQIGAVKWSSKEKSMFYAALDKLGQDDVLGMAKVIKTKSIPEIRELLLLLQDASFKQGDMRLTLRDIPAATEVSLQCSERLELAGDALAWYQERFEAKQEQEKFGEYWLITPEIAQKIEDAVKSSRQGSVVSESAPALGGRSVLPLEEDTLSTVQILLDIPEGNLLNISTLLTLSSSMFMNPCPNLPSPSQHWKELISPLADKPSIYRTALLDLQTLVHSLTKRLTQACIMQATSRIRTQGWRIKKGVNLLVKKRDVNTAIDMLGLKRDGRERWRGVARRSRFRVVDGIGKSRRELSWNEVEEALAIFDRFSDVGITDGATTAAESEAEEEFKARAVRSGTPLPTGTPEDYDFGSENDSDEEYEEEEENVDDSFAPASPESTKASDSPEFEPNTLEDFDREASRNEEARLWDIIGVSPTSKKGSSKREDEVEEPELKATNKIMANNNDWRDWSHYRATWEDTQTPVPTTKFRANQNPVASNYPVYIGLNDTAYDTQAAKSSSSEQPSGRRKKRAKTTEHEIPIRGARAYAAMQEERISVSEDRDADSDESGGGADLAVLSVEDAHTGQSSAQILDEENL
jgi:RNA polymerase I-specific transcription initiation factor RRN5